MTGIWKNLVPFRQVEEIEKLFGVSLSTSNRETLTKMLGDWQDGRVKIELGWAKDGLEEIRDHAVNILKEIDGGRKS